MIISSPSGTGYFKAGKPIPVYTLQDEDKVISSGGSSIVTDRDVILNRTTGTIVDKNKRIVPVSGFPNLSFQSITPEIGTVDQFGLVSRVTNGTAKVNVETKGNKQQIEVALTRVSGQTIDQFSDWSEESLAKSVAEKVDGDIEGKTPTDDILNLFSSINHSTKSYVRNVNLWMNIPVQALTCMSVYNSRYGENFPATAITPRHGLCAKHVGLAVGDSVRFVGSNNASVDRAIIAIHEIPSTIGDIQLILWNNTLPNNITPARLLPSNILDYAPNMEYGIPCVIRNLGMQLTEFDLISVGGVLNVFGIPKITSRLPFYKPLVAPGSGSEALMIVNNQSVLVTKFTYSEKGCPYQNINWAQQIGEIDASVGIATNLLPQIISLGSFESY